MFGSGRIRTWPALEQGHQRTSISGGDGRLKHEGECGVLHDGQQLGEVKVDPPHLGVMEDIGWRPDAANTVIHPPVAELLTGLDEGVHKLCKPGVAGVPADDRMKLGDRGVCTLLPSCPRRAQLVEVAMLVR